MRKCSVDGNLSQIWRVWRSSGPFVCGWHSSRLRFFVSGIHKLVERWDKCFDKLEGYVENESKMPKEFTFEVLNR